LTPGKQERRYISCTR